MTLDPDEGESASSTGNGAFETAAFHANQQLPQSPTSHPFTDKPEGLLLPVIEVAA